jgi:MFS family permease
VSGREIARHGLPTVEHLTVLGQGNQWVDQQWLAQLGLYAAERIGGVGLMVALCLVAVVLAFGLAALAAQERGASPLAILAFFVAAFVVAPWGVQARTQALALPLFSLVVWLLLRDPDARRVSTLWVLPILCLWANVHGSVVLGAAIVSAYGIQALVRTGWHWRAAALAALAPAAVFASPFALRLPGYYKLMLLNPPYGHEIVEWQRTTPSGLTAPFFALVAVTCVLVVLRRRRVTMLDLLMLAITLAAALSAVRLIPWFALTMLAVLPPLVSRAADAPSFRGPAASLLAAFGVTAILVAAGWAASRPYEVSSEARGLAVVREQMRGGLVFADLELADRLLWKIPELRGRIAYDGRPELLSRREFDGVIRFARQEPGWQEFLRGYSLVITNRAIARRMTKTGSWRRVYAADKAFVVVRRAGSG